MTADETTRVLKTDADRVAAAGRCGIAEDQLPAVVEWVTQQFDRGFAWPRGFLDLATALEFRRLFLPEGFRLLQIALPERFVPSFLAMAAPPPQQPGYAPNGATAVYQALVNQAIGVPSGVLRGFEVLGYDQYGGGFHSFRCNDFEKDFAKLGVT